MKRIAQLAAIVLVLACAAFGQASMSESQDFMVAANAAACAGSLQTPPVTYNNCKPLVAGTVTLTHPDQRNTFSNAHSIELNWTGTAAATATITVKGCGRGNTCAGIALASSTSITNTIFPVAAATPYDQLQITVAWTGGDATTFLTVRVTGAVIPPEAAFQNMPGVDDPCANPHIIPINTAIPDITATTKIVSNGGGTTQIYICGLSVDFAGTAAGNFNIRIGTGTNCATGALNKSGTYTGAAGKHVEIGFGGRSVLVAPIAQDFCLFVAGGTSPTFGGFASTITQ